MKRIIPGLFLILFIAGCNYFNTPQKLSRKIEFLNSRLENIYQNNIKKHPDNEIYKLELARFYYNKREYEKAEKILIGLSSPEAKIILAKVYAKRRDYTSALGIFERLEHLEDQEALYLYGLTLEKKNLFSEARKIYSQIEKSPYKELSNQRIKKFKFRFEDKLPQYLEKIVKEAPRRQDFPNASAIILLDQESTKITEDNKAVTDIHMIVKVFNEEGRRNWGEVHIDYDSTYEKVKLEFARTITPDKKIVYIGRENIRDVSKYLNFPLYSNARVFIVSMPQVLKGSIIEYKAKIYRSKLINKKDFSFIYSLKSSCPVVKKTLQFILPRGRTINFKTLSKKYAPRNVNFSAAKFSKGNYSGYSFVFRNVPQLLPESDMVEIPFVNPALVISSFSSWEEIYNWWKDLYQDKLKLSPKLEEFLAKLVENSPDDYEKAKKIYEFCAEKIRYVAVEYGQAGYEPHSPEDVFVNKYGDCKDQAIFLVSLLRAAGLQAYPVLVPTRSVYDTEETEPALYFNHAIAVLKLNGKLIFMDPTAATISFEDLPLQDQDRKVLVFFDKDFKILKTPILKQNILSITMNIGIDSKEQAKIVREIYPQGSFAASERYYLRYTPPELVKNHLEEIMKNVASLSKLLDFKMQNVDSLDKPPILRYSFSALNLLSKAGKLRILPVLRDRVTKTSWIDKEGRNYPLYLGGFYKMNDRITIKLPPNLKIVYLPKNLEIDSKWVDFRLKYFKKGKELILTQSFITKTKQIDEEDYSGFKKIIENIINSAKQQVVLSRD